MKILLVAPLLFVASVQPGLRTERASTDDPPPIECPMCGGNAQLHEKRTTFFCKLGATLFVWRGCSSGVAPSK